MNIQGVLPIALKGVAGAYHLPLGDVGSTTDECLGLFQSHVKADFFEKNIEYLWVTGRSQSKGRGRRGRPWVSEAGNLYASLLILPEIPMDKLSTLPFVSVLAAFNAIKPLLPSSTKCEIKWPNDLLIDGQKISGILLESHSNRAHEQAVIVGCGINVVHCPDAPLYPTTSLLREGVNILPEQLFLMLAKETADLLEVWDCGNGFSKIREMWLANAKGIGKTLRVKINQNEETGVFSGIDEAGCLLLNTPRNGVMKISAGDVFFNE